MKDKRTYLMIAAVAGVMLLGLGLLAGPGAPSPLAATPLPLLDAGEAVAEQEAAPPRRRARASLSMPYFSFAQSLRPRG